MTTTIITKSLSLAEERTFSLYYPSVINLNLCAKTTHEFSFNIKDYNVPLYNTLGFFDPFTLGDLDGKTLGEMDYNI